MDPVPDPQVDVMNDPAYNTNPPNDGTQEGVGEPDHCRICRSEGTSDEPLFHPCKCSGSIKFVHQEWYVKLLPCSLKIIPFFFLKIFFFPPSNLGSCEKLDGMASTFPKETLRAMQNAFPVYKAIRP
jgi:hypothetical protein